MPKLSLVHRAARRAKREIENLSSLILAIHFRLANRFSKASIVSAQSGVMVSMTSHGDRLATVYATIESIGRGRCKPSRLVLWIDDLAVFNQLPASLRRLQQRGLVVQFSENFGPHTKYFPVLESEPLPNVLVTADDDILYPSQWLEILVREHLRSPDLVVCFRAHRVGLTGTGLMPYAHWPQCTATKPSFLHFATGVSGVIYPKRYLECLKLAGRGFVSCTPRNDDVWLYTIAVRNRFQIRQIFSYPIHFLHYPQSQKMALQNENVFGGENDTQIANTFQTDDLDFLYACFREKV